MKKEKVILGESCVYSPDTTKTGLNNNIIVCGTSGCGKTMSITEARLLETYETSTVVTVTKRKIIDKYKELFKSRGYKTIDLDFVNPKKGDVGYDPIKFIHSYNDISDLAEAIIEQGMHSHTTNADPYWERSAVSLLCAEISYVLMTKENPSFADVIDMHNRLNMRENRESISTDYDDIFEEIQEKDPNHFSVTCWNTFKMVPSKTAHCIFSTLNTILNMIFTPELIEMMSKEKTFKIEELAQEKTILFVTSSPVNKAANCFINIFYSLIFKRLFEFAESQPNGKLPIPVHVICDDFATGGKILNFSEYISVFREKELSATILLQSESQLEAMYGSTNATTIINNCDSYVYMGGMDLTTARNISLRLDKPLQEILYMPIGDVIVFRRGQSPVVTKRYNILKNKEYKTLTDKYNSRISACGR